MKTFYKFVEEKILEGDKERKQKYYQDGSNFYQEDTGELIVSYPEMVKNDQDLEGAMRAEERFAREYPQYIKAVI